MWNEAKDRAARYVMWGGGYKVNKGFTVARPITCCPCDCVNNGGCFNTCCLLDCKCMGSTWIERYIHGRNWAGLAKGEPNRYSRGAASRIRRFVWDTNLIGIWFRARGKFFSIPFIAKELEMINDGAYRAGIEKGYAEGRAWNNTYFDEGVDYGSRTPRPIHHSNCYFLEDEKLWRCDGNCTSGRDGQRILIV